jgi:hypothetical protein
MSADLLAYGLPAPELGVELRGKSLWRSARGDATAPALEGAPRLVAP